MKLVINTGKAVVKRIGKNYFALRFLKYRIQLLYGCESIVPQKAITRSNLAGLICYPDIAVKDIAGMIMDNSPLDS